jgi:CheY-like chemotaxis protein
VRRLFIDSAAGARNQGEQGDMPKRILIAEDDPETRAALQHIAIRFGYEVICAADGVDLLTMVAGQKFDAIITDLKMPNLNGASAAEIMKMQGNRTPVIALTALDPRDMSLVQDKFTRIFHKPCDVAELFSYLKSLIEE